MDVDGNGTFIPDLYNSTEDVSNTSTRECYGASRAELDYYHYIAFWFELFPQNIVAGVGVLGNMIAIPILCSKTMKTIFNRMLAALAIFDTLFLAITMIDTFRRHLEFHQLYIYFFVYFTFPIQNIAFGCSIFLPVAMSFERYRAIKHPVTYHNSNAGQNINRKTLLYYILPVFVASIIAVFPRFLEITVERESEMTTYRHPVTDEVVAEEENVSHRLNYTPMRFNDHYVLWYLNIFRLVFFGIGPFASMVYFNYNIGQIIRRRGNLQHQNNSAVKTAATKQCYILLAICVMFVVCHAFRMGLGVHEIFVIDEYRESMAKKCSSVKFHVLILGMVSHFFLTTNSSLNFFIYCVMSQEFRDTLKTVIKERFISRCGIFSAPEEQQEQDLVELQNLAPANVNGEPTASVANV